MTQPRNPTVYDVANLAGVSISTVSRVLNSPEMVRIETRSRVMAAVDELGFVPRAEATARARKAVGRVGILSPFFAFPSFIQRMRGAAAYLAGTPYELIIYPVDSPSRLDGYLSMLPITRRLDGLILMSMRLNETSAQRLVANHLETVLIEIQHPGLNCILIDDYHGGWMAAEYLYDKGHRRCAFFGPAELPEYSIHPEEARLKGFRDGLFSKGVLLPDDLIQCSRQTATDVRQELDRLMGAADPPTAVFAASDEIAIRILRAARESRIRVPDDLSVLGFDDIDMADQVGLTTISQSLDESGRMAAELLTARLADPNRPPQKIQLGLELVQRETA